MASDRRPKVVFVSHAPDAIYGAERFLVELVVRLQESQRCVPLVVVPGPGEMRTVLEAAGIPVIVVEQGWWVDRRPGRERPWRVKVEEGVRFLPSVLPWSKNIVDAVRE